MGNYSTEAVDCGDHLELTMIQCFGRGATWENGGMQLIRFCWHWRFGRAGHLDSWSRISTKNVEQINQWMEHAHG